MQDKRTGEAWLVRPCLWSRDVDTYKDRKDSVEKVRNESATKQDLRTCKRKNIVRYVKSKRIQWLRHVEQIKDQATTKKMLKGRVYKDKGTGRPTQRWIDEV